MASSSYLFRGGLEVIELSSSSCGSSLGAGRWIPDKAKPCHTAWQPCTDRDIDLDIATWKS
eukprot:3360684-Alexandrium_andersonii.AAC.1